MFDGFRSYCKPKNWVDKKNREKQFSESVHCYSPTPPIGRRRPNKQVILKLFWNPVNENSQTCRPIIIVIQGGIQVNHCNTKWYL